MIKWLLIALLALPVAGCQKRPEEKRSEQKVRFSINRPPTTMDPRKGGDVVSVTLQFLLFEGLTKIEEDGSISYAMAKRIDLSEDHKTYTFHLRNALWSDGSPVTAYDFEKAWKDNLNPSFPALNAHLFYAIKNAEAVKKGLLPLDAVGIRSLDAATFQVELSHPIPYFLSIISFSCFAPINRTIDEKNPEWALQAGDHFVSNGPFLLQSWKQSDSLDLIKNPLYWNAEQIQLDKIQVCIIDNEMTALHMYEHGELDMISSPLSPIPIDALEEYRKKGELTTLPEPGTTVCFFNTEQFPFNNVNIRKAFAYAINREEIINSITQLNEPIATGPVPPILKGKNRLLFPDNAVKEARLFLEKGLEELGLASAKELGEINYYYFSTEVNRKIAQAIQHQWFEAFGLRVKLIQLDYKHLMESLTQRTFMVAQALWLAQYQDQMNILERFKSRINPKNYPGWENEEYRMLLETSNLAPTAEERQKLLDRAEELFAEEMPASPIYHWNSALLVKPHLKVISTPPSGGLFFEKLSILPKEAAR
jgi:oligopeptide transport system substrate-binding protein